MKQTIRMFAIMFAMLTAWQIGLAQTRTVTGSVKDNKGEAIIGASIVAKGTTLGTYSDESGNYSIAIPAQTPETRGR